MDEELERRLRKETKKHTVDNWPHALPEFHESVADGVVSTVRNVAETYDQSDDEPTILRPGDVVKLSRQLIENDGSMTDRTCGVTERMEELCAEPWAQDNPLGEVIKVEYVLSTSTPVVCGVHIYEDYNPGDWKFHRDDLVLVHRPE